MDLFLTGCRYSTGSMQTRNKTLENMQIEKTLIEIYVDSQWIFSFLTLPAVAPFQRFLCVTVDEYYCIYCILGIYHDLLKLLCLFLLLNNIVKKVKSVSLSKVCLVVC